MKNIKAFLMGETAVKLVLAVIASLVLLALGAAIYSSFIRTDLGDKANIEITQLQAELQRLNAGSGPLNYVVLHAPDWFLTSATRGGLCGDNAFCLCICKSETCIQASEGEIERACVITDRFVSIRTTTPEYKATESPEDTFEVRYVKLRGAPSELTLTYIDKKVYPKTDSKREDGRTDGLPPTFYQFQEEWKWGLDLTYWMKTSGTLVTEGVFDSSGLFGLGLNYFKTDRQNNFEEYSENIAIINLLDRAPKNEEEGNKLLEKFEVTESNGVYRIDV